MVLVDPADKRLAADDISVAVCNRLEIRPKIAVFDGIRKLCRDSRNAPCSEFRLWFGCYAEK